MRVALDIFKCAALLAFTLLCLSFARSMHGLSQQAFITMAKLDDEIDEMHRFTLEAGLTAMEARKASAKESKYLDTWNAQIGSVMSDVDGVTNETSRTVASIRGTTEQATETLKALQPTIAQATDTLKAAQSTTAALQPVIVHLDALVSDPEITATIAHTDATMSHVDATTADVEQEVHSLTHPTWAHKLFGWTLDVVHAVNPL